MSLCFCGAALSKDASDSDDEPAKAASTPNLYLDLRTYYTTVPAGSLTDSQKGDLAKAITRIHVEVAGGRRDLRNQSLHALQDGRGRLAANRTHHISPLAWARSWRPNLWYRLGH